MVKLEARLRKTRRFCMGWMDALAQLQDGSLCAGGAGERLGTYPGQRIITRSRRGRLLWTKVASRMDCS